jgi:hypothetical protein
LPLAPRPFPLHLGVGDDFDRLVHVVEDDQLAVEAEGEVGQAAVVLGGGGELFAFVVADRVVTRVADEAAGESGEGFVVVVAALGEEALQVG